jgi:hypothetical protein
MAKEMKEAIVLAIVLMTCSCSQLFFGGKVVSSYHKHFENKLECAYVEGWYAEKTCMCWVCESNFSSDRSFLVSDEIFCKRDINQ